MAKKKKSNKNRILIVALVLILIFIIIFSIYQVIKKNKENYTISMKKVDGTYEEKIENMFIVQNLYELVELSNRVIPTKEYTDGLESLVNSLPLIYDETKELNESQLKKKYTQEKDEIFEEYGIDSFETYQQIVEKSQIHENLQKISEVRIEENSCEVDGDFITGKIKVTYESGQTIEMTIQFVNSGKIGKPYLRIQGE